MKTRSNLLSAVGLLVLCLLAVWLFLANGAASAGPAPVNMLAETIVGGTIITDTIWSLEGSPYVLQTQNVTVNDGVTLTIEPGVTVELNAGRILYVHGTLLAMGTPTQPITFTRMAGATGPWHTVMLGGGSVLTDSNATQISHATIEGGERALMRRCSMSTAAPRRSTTSRCGTAATWASTPPPCPPACR